MPSKTKPSTTEPYPQLQIEELTALSSQVHEYVAGEQWEQLVAALKLRQQCLEALFSETPIKSDDFKAIANSILEQDSAFIEKIQEQKKLVEKQIQELDKGRQAIQAYNA